MTAQPSNGINYCMRCGNVLGLEERFGKVRLVCPHCEWIYFADPKVAVAALIVNKGNVLLVRRAVNPQKGLWTLPAGFMDAGEDPKEALARECLEELGVELGTVELIDVLYSGEHVGSADILIAYKADIISGMLQPGDDIDMADFFPFNALPPLAFSTTEKLITRMRHQLP